MIPTPNQVTHKIKYQAIKNSKIIPRSIAIKGSINNRNAEINCLAVFEIFNSIVHHILINNLMSLLKTDYLSLTRFI